MFPSEQWEVAVPAAGVGVGGVPTLMTAAPGEGRGKTGLGPELGLRVGFQVPQPQKVAGLHTVSIQI